MCSWKQNKEEVKMKFCCRNKLVACARATVFFHFETIGCRVAQSSSVTSAMVGVASGFLVLAGRSGARMDIAGLLLPDCMRLTWLLVPVSLDS